MHDLYLFAFLLLAVSVKTGLGPAVFIAVLVEAKYPYFKKVFLILQSIARTRAFRGPTRNLCRKVVSNETEIELRGVQPSRVECGREHEAKQWAQLHPDSQDSLPVVWT